MAFSFSKIPLLTYLTFVTLFATHYGLTFCLFMGTLYDTTLVPTLFLQTYTITVQPDVMPKSLNELLRHWRSGWGLVGLSPFNLPTCVAFKDSFAYIFLHSMKVDVINSTRVCLIPALPIHCTRGMRAGDGDGHRISWPWETVANRHVQGFVTAV